MKSVAEMREDVRMAFCTVATPTEGVLEEYLGSVAESDREQLRAGLTIRPEVRTPHEISYHALNVISASGLQWLLPTYLFFALDHPVATDGEDRLYFNDLYQFIEPWESDLDIKSAYGQPWEFAAMDHLEWITQVMAELSPQQKQVIASVAQYLASQESEPGRASRALELRWGEFL